MFFQWKNSYLPGKPLLNPCKKKSTSCFLAFLLYNIIK